MADQKLRFIAEWIDKGLKAGSKDAEASLKRIQKVMDQTASISMQKYNAQMEASAKKQQAMTEAGERFKKQLIGLGGTLVAAGAALKKFWDFAKAGAELEVTAIRFDRLSESIGTTADVLDSQLKVATSGMLSQSERMALATDIVGLGLTKNADQTVRLAKVVSQLGADMGQVTLALTNRTTARFDQIGLRVEGFQEKLESLMETGLSLEDAFTEAFLQQGEQQLELYGSVAETSAGKIMKFEAAWKDMGDAFKLMSARELSPALDKWTRLMDLVNNGDISRFKANWVLVRELLAGNTNKIEELEQAQQSDTQTTYQQTSAWAYLGDLWMTQTIPEAENVKKGFQDVNNVVRDMGQYAKDVTGAFNDMWGAANKDWGNVFEKIRDGGEFIESGGLGFQKLGENIEKAAGMAANLGEDVAKDTAPKLKEAANQSQLAWLQYQVAVGDITAYEAQRIAIEDLGLSNRDAYLAMTQDVGNWNAAAEEAALKIQAIIDMLARLDGTSSKVSIYVKEITQKGTATQGGYGTGGQVNVTSPSGLFAQQAGGNFVVPPSYTGDSFPVRATAGERVETTTASNTAKAERMKRLQARQDMDYLAQRITEGILLGIS